MNSDGFCSVCAKWAVDHPALACPWCRDVNTAQVRERLKLDPIEQPVAVVAAVRDELQELARQRRELMKLRAVAAREILRRGNVAELAKEARSHVKHLERWAVSDALGAKTPGLRARKAGNRLSLTMEERLALREEAFRLREVEATPERLRPSLGTRQPPAQPAPVVITPPWKQSRPE